MNLRLSCRSRHMDVTRSVLPIVEEVEAVVEATRFERDQERTFEQSVILPLPPAFHREGTPLGVWDGVQVQDTRTKGTDWPR